MDGEAVPAELPGVFIEFEAAAWRVRREADVAVAVFVGFAISLKSMALMLRNRLLFRSSLVRPDCWISSGSISKMSSLSGVDAKGARGVTPS